MGYSRLNHPGFATTAPTSDMKKATFWKTSPETLININFGKTSDRKLGERAELTRPPQSFLQALRTATKKTKTVNYNAMALHDRWRATISKMNEHQVRIVKPIVDVTRSHQLYLISRNTNNHIAAPSQAPIPTIAL